VNSPSQPSDRLRDILQRARERHAAAAAAPAAQQEGQATVEALLDKSQPLPDPRALSRLYREQALAQLPDESDEAAPASTATSGHEPVAPGSSAQMQPLPTGGAMTSQPPMSPAEMRAVMKSLQEQFSTSTYRVYEVPKAPPDDFGAVQLQERDELEEQERQELELEQLARDARRSNVAYLVGALLVVVVIGTFLYLAISGPLKAPAPSATPSASARP
jgi:hypothetical protein